MIIVELIGGLGNQMFQYAFARSMSLKKNIKFKIDITGFSNYLLRRYELNNLNIYENIASQNELQEFDTRLTDKFKLLEKIKPYYKRSVIVEKYPFGFDQNVFLCNDKSYLKGYWQNEKYFKDIKNILNEEFRVKTPLKGKNYELAQIIRNTNSVAIHIRRKDYVTDSITADTHGTCSLDYYKDSIHLINEKIKDPQYFIFSDDIIWAKNNLGEISHITYAEHNNSFSNYEDLRLMYLCKHNIIANSSFSWWGAWLNTNPAKLVIAPKIWLKTPTIYSVEHLPNDWIIV